MSPRPLHHAVVDGFHVRYFEREDGGLRAGVNRLAAPGLYPEAQIDMSPSGFMRLSAPYNAPIPADAAAVAAKIMADRGQA